MKDTGGDGKMSVTLRRAERKDAPALIRLIRAQADFEKLPPPDAAAEARLRDHGFGDHPRFEAWLAPVPGCTDPVGYALIFETYSTFLAKPTLYIEDILVLPDWRGRGIGSALLRQCVQLAHARDCGRVEWTCLDWNTRAQQVSEAKVGARKMSEWWQIA